MRKVTISLTMAALILIPILANAAISQGEKRTQLDCFVALKMMGASSVNKTDLESVANILLKHFKPDSGNSGEESATYICIFGTRAGWQLCCIRHEKRDYYELPAGFVPVALTSAAGHCPLRPDELRNCMRVMTRIPYGSVDVNHGTVNFSKEVIAQHQWVYIAFDEHGYQGATTLTK